MSDKIAVIGLGYVGLPLALELANKSRGVVGFDINRKRVEELRDGFDRTCEVQNESLNGTTLEFANEVSQISDCTAFIVTVPTPVDEHNTPDFKPLLAASDTVGQILKKGDLVIYESTVYPGVTEEICGARLEQISGLTQGKDFFLGYSPERINPGDSKHSLTKVTKVVAATDAASLDRVRDIYGPIIEAGLHETSSIQVAEAAKVIENTQRDLNIALMNELAIIFDKMGLSTLDVLEAAGTKWNFLPFRPGLVGGHCIGVDPYYLTCKAKQLGYHPEVILAGRRINDSMGAFVAAKCVKLLIAAKKQVRDARVGVLGLSFKEEVPDLRNSRVPDIINELADFGVNTLVHDPMIDADEAFEEYGIRVCKREELNNLDAVIVAVGHSHFKEEGFEAVVSSLADNSGVVIDVKSIFKNQADQAMSDIGSLDGVEYWSL